MANRIKAINAYRPRIDLGKRIGMHDLVIYIADRTGLNEGEIQQVLLEMRDAVAFFTLRGQPVKLDGLGTYTPTIDLQGTFGIGHRADTSLKNRLNTPGAFQGTILNRENIGKTSAELINRWNAEHPNDPVES